MGSEHTQQHECTLSNVMRETQSAEMCSGDKKSEKNSRTNLYKLKKKTKNGLKIRILGTCKKIPRGHGKNGHAGGHTPSKTYQKMPLPRARPNTRKGGHTPMLPSRCALECRHPQKLMIERELRTGKRNWCIDLTSVSLQKVNMEMKSSNYFTTECAARL